ncbi:uncharacterized protein LOC130589406 [Beta vulgaris subsp. vulgaris]|uniref:uncharacterized protein LOC130589406 n=1 Tax=Beta vulgaris subsp. vulgaris TaxID=3555 RepID=UPI002548DA59|nr:uncharacterized protein LOC130589406 [Beta vulgaris subsp. vulgaris]
MLSLLISGPKQPGNDIDIYLAPLIEDLKKMWDEGVMVFDAYSNEDFRLRAMLFCTINDYPAYGNLSGYKVKGKKACPICENGMEATHLPHCGKHVYIINRQFLHSSHPYRKKKAPFNGFVENGPAPIPLTGKEVYNRVKGMGTIFGKGVKPSEDDGVVWKKESIFWRLPYWKYLPVRHCLDVMHIEKNVCDAIIGTLLNMPGKTKDGLKVRRDMEKLKIRPNLWPKVKEKAKKGKGTTTYLPPACYTLSRKEKRLFCECLYGIKVPTGYSSNMRRLVSMTDLKLIGLKSHDCHVMMQVFLPIAIRGILPKHVRLAITRLCSFFNTICNKVLDPDRLDALQNEVVITLCQFEMYFPPSFFDIMVHLVLHLVREIKLCGPVFLRWAYPFERHMGSLKKKVKNPARPEASIIQGTIAEEVGGYCSSYFAKAVTIGLPKSRHEGRLEGKGGVGMRHIAPSLDELHKAHLFVLHHVTEVNPYLERHMRELRHKNPSKGERALMNEHNRSFIDWFHNKVIGELSANNHHVPDTIKWLAYGPRDSFNSYEGYDINGYTFYTERQDKKSKVVQNCGVSTIASSREYASAKDKTPIDATQSYYGIIQEIWELDYCDFTMPIFRCKWADNRRGLQKDECGFTLVNMSRLRDTEEPFILASQAKQVFYVSDPVDTQWCIVVNGKRRILGVVMLTTKKNMISLMTSPLSQSQMRYDECD